MKKILFVLMLAALLSGCSARETFETVSDVYDVPAMVQSKQIKLTLPKEAATASMGDPEAGKIYLCDGYTVTVQTLDGGDLDRSLRQLTGYAEEKLLVMQTSRDDITRYESVWTAAGEGGDQVGRVVILDDGSCHYAVTVMADSFSAGELMPVWQDILDSVKLVSTD